MSRAIIVFAGLLALLFTGCSHNKPATAKKNAPGVLGKAKTKDTLAYTYEGENGNKGCPQDSCDYIAIDYPVFKTRTSLNDTIKKMVLGTLSSYSENSDDTTKSLSARVKKIVDNYTSRIDTSNGNRIPMTYEFHIGVMSQDSSVLVLEIGEEQSGGVHPNSASTYMIWDTKKDEEIVLSDVLVKNYEEKLDAIADKIIREEKLNEDLFEGDTFALNSNYYFSPEGIHFYYNSYEIKPYMAGPTDLLIPYSKIKKLIRPGSVLSQYIK